jgi:multisubunit Na+/H+ antiporter MnhF subunit
MGGGLLMGLIALFISWVGNGESANGITWIKDMEWFEDDGGAPWFSGLFALLAFIGVGLLGLAFLAKVIPGNSLPDASGIGGLGALMLALGPLLAFISFWVQVGVEYRMDAGDVWDLFWASDGPGIWLALAAGIIAYIGSVAVAKRQDRSF